MKTPELALALAATILQLCLLVLLVVRQYYTRFPAFFGCIALSCAETLTGLAVRNHPALYLKIYWIGEALYVLLAFLALLEIFRSVFSGFYHLPWFRFLFPSIGILMIVIAIIRYMAKPPAQAGRLLAIIIFLEFAVRFLQLGTLFLFFALVRFFHMAWRQHAFGIAMGFGVSAAGSLIVFLLRSEFGTKVNYLVRITPPIAYTLAVVIWLLTFLTPQPERPLPGKALALTPEEMLTEIRQYTRTVKEILKK